MRACSLLYQIGAKLEPQGTFQVWLKELMSLPVYASYASLRAFVRLMERNCDSVLPCKLSAPSSKIRVENRILPGNHSHGADWRGVFLGEPT